MHIRGYNLRIYFKFQRSGNLNMHLAVILQIFLKEKEVFLTSTEAYFYELNSMQ